MKPTVKILFLDFDGVLNSFRSMIVTTKFDETSVQLIRDFVTRSKSKIVITSAWRYSQTLEEMRDIFRNDHGWDDVSDYIIDAMGTEEATRGWQIDGWIFRYEKANNCSVRPVIIDDRDDMEPYMHRLVKTDMRDGLLHTHYEQLWEKDRA